MKKGGIFASVSVLVAAVWTVLGSGGVAFAAVTSTCTWTGGGTDAKFSTAANWSCDTGTVPQAGSAVVIDVFKAPTSGSMTNDANVALASLTLSNTDTGTTFHSATVDTVQLAPGGTLVGGIANSQLTVQSVTSTGDITTSIQSTGSQISVWNYNVQGTLTLSAGTYFAQSGSSSSIGTLNVQNGATASFSTAASGDTVLPMNITLGGGQSTNPPALDFTAYCQNYDQKTYTCTSYATVNYKMTGTVTANADATVNIQQKGATTATITNALAGSGKLVYSQISEGDLIINGVTQPYPSDTQTVSNNFDCNSYPNGFVTVSRNQTVILGNSQRCYGYVVVDGVLKGNGTFKADATYAWGGRLTINEGAFIAPGNSPGCITADELTLNGTYQFEFGGNDPCTGYDQLTVTNQRDSATATQPGYSALQIGANAKLDVSQYGTFLPKKDQVFTIINNQSKYAVNGVFSGLPEGTTFVASGVVFKISYVGGDGNDVTLTVVSVPKTPNTGFAKLQANPMMIGVGTLLALGAVLLVRMKRAHR